MRDDLPRELREISEFSPDEVTEATMTRLSELADELERELNGGSK
jgi:hypothetical protein